jgi:hypothetical protein
MGLVFSGESALNRAANRRSAMNGPDGLCLPLRDLNGGFSKLVNHRFARTWKAAALRHQQASAEPTLTVSGRPLPRRLHIDRSQMRLREEAALLGKRFFEDPPAEFVRRIESYWFMRCSERKDWQSMAPAVGILGPHDIWSTSQMIITPNV